MSPGRKSESVKAVSAVAGGRKVTVDPQVKQAVAKIVDRSLMPIAAINFAFDKAQEYFSDRFKDEITRKLEKIPPELLVEPKAYIAGPILQGLAFSHDERGLKEMYLGLLAAAMNHETASQAHPAFVEIIKQLSTTETVLLGKVLCSQSGFAMVEIRRATDANNAFIIEHRNLIDIRESSAGRPKEDPAVSAQIDNWVRLGLVSAGYDRRLSGETAYKWVEDRPEYRQSKARFEGDQSIVYYQRGYLERTSLGIQFAKSVGLF